MAALSTHTQERLMRHLMTGHPFPWRLEFDWSVEVTDAVGAVVIKCLHVDEAHEIIARARFLAGGDEVVRAEFERMLMEPTP